MSDDRFARQDRFELPSEFLLTSPCTSIVHHLSGRTTMTITAKNEFKKNHIFTSLMRIIYNNIMI